MKLFILLLASLLVVAYGQNPAPECPKETRQQVRGALQECRNEIRRQERDAEEQDKDDDENEKNVPRAGSGNLGSIAQTSTEPSQNSQKVDNGDKNEDKRNGQMGPGRDLVRPPFAPTEGSQKGDNGGEDEQGRPRGPPRGGPKGEGGNRKQGKGLNKKVVKCLDEKLSDELFYQNFQDSVCRDVSGEFKQKKCTWKVIFKECGIGGKKDGKHVKGGKGGRGGKRGKGESGERPSNEEGEW